MILISTTHKPATDLGYLLHKNPQRVHEAELPFGKATLVYPEADEDRCSAAVLLEVDSVALARGDQYGRWSQYVNDRPYVTSSFLCRALTEFFATAMSGRSKERQELADTPIPLEIHLPVIKARGGETLIKGLFEPLGYQVDAEHLPLDPMFPEWGPGSYYSVRLSVTARLKDALEHLYVLIPVLDDDKHYWVNKDEIDKLFRRGGGWLPTHPIREEITRRYLRHERILTRAALERLAEMDGVEDPDSVEQAADEKLEKLEAPISLHTQRLDAVVQALVDSGARRIADLGCGEGKLIAKLIRKSDIKSVVGVDVSLSSLERVKSRLRWDTLSDKVKEKLTLIHGSVTYRDRDLEDCDAVALVEVIEHLDLERLKTMERVVFEFMRPKTVVVTTPNREYNALFVGMNPEQMRHGDHRFEWSRAEFEEWCQAIQSKFKYEYEISPIGTVDENLGAPSQMAVFSL